MLTMHLKYLSSALKRNRHRCAVENATNAKIYVASPRNGVRLAASEHSLRLYQVHVH